MVESIAAGKPPKKVTHEHTELLFQEKSLDMLVAHVTILTLARDVDVPPLYLDEPVCLLRVH